jgi:hypothetical protein
MTLAETLSLSSIINPKSQEPISQDLNTNAFLKSPAFLLELLSSYDDYRTMELLCVTAIPSLSSNFSKLLKTLSGERSLSPSEQASWQKKLSKEFAPFTPTITEAQFREEISSLYPEIFTNNKHSIAFEIANAIAKDIFSDVRRESGNSFLEEHIYLVTLVACHAAVDFKNSDHFPDGAFEGHPQPIEFVTALLLHDVYEAAEKKRGAITDTAALKAEALQRRNSNSRYQEISEDALNDIFTKCGNIIDQLTKENKHFAMGVDTKMQKQMRNELHQQKLLKAPVHVQIFALAEVTANLISDAANRYIGKDQKAALYIESVYETYINLYYHLKKDTRFAANPLFEQLDTLLGASSLWYDKKYLECLEQKNIPESLRMQFLGTVSNDVSFQVPSLTDEIHLPWHDSLLKNVFTYLHKTTSQTNFPCSLGNHFALKQISQLIQNRQIPREATVSWADSILLHFNKITDVLMSNAYERSASKHLHELVELAGNIAELQNIADEVVKKSAGQETFLTVQSITGRLRTIEQRFYKNIATILFPERVKPEEINEVVATIESFIKTDRQSTVAENASPMQLFQYALQDLVQCADKAYAVLASDKSEFFQAFPSLHTTSAEKSIPELESIDTAFLSGLECLNNEIDKTAGLLSGVSILPFELRECEELVEILFRACLEAYRESKSSESTEVEIPAKALEKFYTGTSQHREASEQEKHLATTMASIAHNAWCNKGGTLQDIREGITPYLIITHTTENLSIRELHQFVKEGKPLSEYTTKTVVRLNMSDLFDKNGEYIYSDERAVQALPSGIVLSTVIALFPEGTAFEKFDQKFIDSFDQGRRNVTPANGLFGPVEMVLYRLKSVGIISGLFFKIAQKLIEGASTRTNVNGVNFKNKPPEPIKDVLAGTIVYRTLEAIRSHGTPFQSPSFIDGIRNNFLNRVIIPDIIRNIIKTMSFSSFSSGPLGVIQTVVSLQNTQPDNQESQTKIEMQLKSLKTIEMEYSDESTHPDSHSRYKQNLLKKFMETPNYLDILYVMIFAASGNHLKDGQILPVEEINQNLINYFQMLGRTEGESEPVQLDLVPALFAQLTHESKLRFRIV